MKTLNLYVTKSFVTTLTLTIIVVTFGLMGVHLIKVFEYLSRGIPLGAAGNFLLYIMPVALSLAIPFGVLVSVMLVFGRLSADNEITAMRACGVSILQIISPIIIITFALTCVCVYLRVDIGPYYSGMAKNLVREVGVKQPLAILEPGRPVEYEDIIIYVDKRIGENKIKDIQIFRMDKHLHLPSQDITATDGVIEVDNENQILKVVLDNATIVDYSHSQEHPQRTFGKRLEFPMNYGQAFNKMKISKKAKHLNINDLFGRTIMFKRLGKDTTKLEIELNQRIALALAPIAFLLLGIPLAIRTSRRETSVGLFMSVILAGIYFIAILICNNLHMYPAAKPQILLWIPNILYQGFGAYFLFRIARR